MKEAKQVTELDDPARGAGGMSPEQKPKTLAELGVREAILEDLALKTLYLFGPFTTRELSKHMKVGFDVATQLYNRLRAAQFCQVTGMLGSVPEIAITTQGRARALELLAQNHYSGATPVSLEQYVAQVRRQSVRNVVVHEEDVQRAFKHLVISPKVATQIGTALNSGSSIFLHGPSGVGKTAIAETMSRVLAEDHIWVPYSVDVDGQIIAVFDPMIHKAVKQPDGRTSDERWVRCSRPSVLVGGELTVDMLDLEFNAGTRFYTAPLQMKANNGVLIVDDFGRQRIRPEDLLNRWVVPLDRGIDFFTLAGGRKIEVPFEMLVVFATNMDPAQLVEGAFLRRIQTKIHIDSCSDEQFSEIFRRFAAQRSLQIDDALLMELIGVIRNNLGQELRGCHPRDLVNQVCWAARYENHEPRLDRASLIAAVEAYFINRS